MRKGLLFALLMASSMLSFGQSDISNKLSISTQMFIDERDGALELKRNVDAEKRLGLEFVGKRLKANKNDDRIYAAPDTIDGRAYISAFIRLDNNADVKTLTNKGVRIQSSFDNGLYTALIPVNSIEEVARLSNVKRINVSMLMRPFTNNARSASNVDDVLTKSADAVALGLSQKYDGTGVVLGVIDTGIDFQHIAFKDASGNSRIKRAYVYNGSSAKEYTSITSSSPTTDDKSETTARTPVQLPVVRVSSSAAQTLPSQTTMPTLPTAVWLRVPTFTSLVSMAFRAPIWPTLSKRYVTMPMLRASLW